MCLTFISTNKINNTVKFQVLHDKHILSALQCQHLNVVYKKYLLLIAKFVRHIQMYCIKKGRFLPLEILVHIFTTALYHLHVPIV